MGNRTEVSFQFHHIGVAVASLDQAQADYQVLIGYRVLSGPFDDPIQKVSVSFMGSTKPHDPLIDLVAPGTPDSPISKVLAKGIGAYHLCYEVDELDIALEHFRSGR